MDWFRWHTGSSTDPKFRVVARRAAQEVPGVRLSDVLAVWAMLLERASEADERGMIDGYDCEGADAHLDLPDGAACAIIKAMQDKGLISAERVCKWDQRQPKREDATATERKRAQREREKSHPVAHGHDMSRTVAHGHDMSRTVTHGHDRLEEIRGEEEKTVETFGLSSSADAADPVESPPPSPGIPESEIIRAYHERLPSLPRIVVLNKTRRGNLRARWTEDKSRQSPEWWDGYFARVGECPHLLGDNDRGWTASWDWLMKPANMLKVLEGNYDRRQARSQASGIDAWRPKEMRQ